MRFVLVYDSNNPNSSPDRYQIIRSYHLDVQRAIQKALEDAGHHVTPLRLNADFKDRLRIIQPDFAFNCSLKSLDGNAEAIAPRILRELGIPFTGSDAQACLNAYRKNRSKQILDAAGIPTPQSILIRDPRDFQLPRTLVFPLFLKPAKGGCSFGIGGANLIREKANLREKLVTLYQRIKQPVLLEEFMGGREFTTGILGNNPARVLPIMEFRYKKDDSQPFRSFSLKMVDFADEECRCPAELIMNDQTRLEALALKAFHTLGCRDYARIDLRMNCMGQPYVLEVNALPNLMPETSSYAIMAKRAGLSFNALIERILECAGRRYGMQLS